ncbi:MAG: hypothetical protein ACOCRK_06170, partial [bacterium]
IINLRNNFIKDYLYNVFKDFKNNIDMRSSFCDLKELNYQNCNFPKDYNNILQQYYLLKYFYTYFYQYYVLYKNLLNYKFIKPPYKIISFGSGAFVDYFALKFVLLENNIKIHKNLYYTGIDKTDWKYYNWKFKRWEYITQKNNTDKIIKDIDEIKNLKNNDYNIVIFPYSLSELNNSFKNLSIILNNISKSPAKVAFLATHLYNSSDKSMYNFGNFLTKLLKDNKEYRYKYIYYYNYVNEDELRTYCEIPKGSIADNLGFDYPKDILEYLVNLKNKCNCEELCPVNDRPSPMMSKKYIYNQIIRLEKKRSENPNNLVSKFQVPF